MTEIEQKALALVNEIEHERGEDELTPRIMRGLIIDEALCRAIEQHEAFRQEVSDALMANTRETPSHVFGLEKWVDLQRFIIPKPKPDPLVEVLGNIHLNGDPSDEAKAIRDELAARGLEIREKGK